MGEQINTIKSQEEVNWRNILIGVVGLLIICYGNLLPADICQKTLYLIGCCCLLTASSLERVKVFVLMQLVVLSGTIVAFLPWTQFDKALVPIVASSIVIGYLLFQGVVGDYVLGIGIISLLFIAGGYAVSNPLVYLFGGFFSAAYSYLSYRQGVKIGMVYFILNLIFICTSSIGVYHMFA